jgi:hypothetical protein
MNCDCRVVHVTQVPRALGRRAKLATCSILSAVSDKNNSVCPRFSGNEHARQLLAARLEETKELSSLLTRAADQTGLILTETACSYLGKGQGDLADVGYARKGVAVASFRLRKGTCSGH